ncbi:UDP-N-acetylmuramyl-tripeptide synthetase [Candidatus Kaiserbacteria bacterium]|nr:UDP-N-acetylmuramyl-tripeptide synthetase [Candidatus Kaiserbacteria bacterium]MCB9812418.1 UDP-N-acetylmuramyl-tripeptide synthetase [Candidatus Nomurabacteria bacterium]
MDTVRQLLKKIIPRSIFCRLQPPYHFLLALLGALRYRHPSRDIMVIGVTGTKGKSSTTEILGQLLRAGGHKVATLSTIQFSIDGHTERNLFKMTMPGRFFVQKFLRDAVHAGCTHAVIEMTSEGAKQFRHRFIDIDALIFTNLAPEHIESHGSFEKYKAAKLSIAQAVADSPKRPRYLVANIDNEHGPAFLDFSVEQKLPYSLKDLTLYSLHKDSISLIFGNTTMRVPLIGLFNVYNTLAAITMARALDIPLTTIQKALHELPPLKGRVETFESPVDATKRITAVVDYAHTPDSLTKLYEAFPDKYKVCVLGNTGGGRDTWKRPEMGAIAEKFCDQIILTNEDPYDEDPMKIVHDMQKGMSEEAPVRVIMDRTEAIRSAIAHCSEDGYVLISGKGTDPYIMGPQGTKTPWSDAATVTTLLQELSIPSTSSEEV